MCFTPASTNVLTATHLWQCSISLTLPCIFLSEWPQLPAAVLVGRECGHGNSIVSCSKSLVIRAFRVPLELCKNRPWDSRKILVEAHMEGGRETLISIIVLICLSEHLELDFMEWLIVFSDIWIVAHSPVLVADTFFWFIVVLS